MSQNKTVVPGMENANVHHGGDYQTDFYSRSTNVRSAAKGTVVPGMERNNQNVNAQQRNVSHQPSGNVGGKPVAGFLYSISRQGIGEYWPLYLGQNTIGSSDRCDICLREGTVSGEHAVIVVRKMRNPEKTIASISDARSTNGTMVNNESLGFSAVECFNGDIITIGENYELVLLLIDVQTLGLRVSENFIPLERETPFVGDDGPYTPNGGSTRAEDYPPSFRPHDMYDSRPTDGTVGLDGTGGGIKSGGTVGL